MKFKIGQPVRFFRSKGRAYRADPRLYPNEGETGIVEFVHEDELGYEFARLDHSSVWCYEDELFPVLLTKNIKTEDYL